MSTKSTMKISVPPMALRLTWTSLADTGWNDDVIFEIVQRYCDAQDHAKSYRTKAALKTKLLKLQLEKLASSAGMSVEEYLEMESANLTESA